MTRKHFKAIARIVDNNSLMDDKYVVKNSLVSDLCDYFECINDRFDRDLFVSACNDVDLNSIFKKMNNDRIDKLKHP
tara:strand:+ start:1032 stop:1262 length:231 start_codon:yes stop_codon:yes gene_type:complete